MGDFVCDFPGELASYSAAELASLAHVSKTTVSRFIDLMREQIEKSEGQLLYITDEGATFLTGATWHIHCQTLAPWPLLNHVSVMALCHLIITRCLEHADVVGRSRSGCIEV